MTPPTTLDDVATYVDEHGVEMLRPETEPVPEHALHAEIVDLLYAGLRAHFADRTDVAVHERLAWFPEQSNTRIRLDPDVMVVIGRPQLMRKSFKAWAEDGAVPTVLVEVVSEEDTDRSYRERLGRAHRYGVPEVVLIHPFAPGGCYVQHLLAEEEGYRTRATSTSPDAPVEVPTLGIRLAGGDRLVAEDEYGPWQDTASLAEHVRRQTEEARRQGERADRLAEALRAAGIDPDSI